MSDTLMTAETLRPYVSICLDDTGNCYGPEFVAQFIKTGLKIDRSVANARYVVWQCGFEPMVVAVFSYLPDTTLSIDDAEEIAIDYLREKNWFADPAHTESDYVL